MPEIRRRLTRLRRGLTRHEIMLFSLGPPFQGSPAFTRTTATGAIVPIGDEELRQLYLANREAILASPGNEHPLHLWCYWQYEPGLPPELRQRPEYRAPRVSDWGIDLQ